MTRARVLALGGAAVCLLAAAYLASNLGDERSVERANALGLRGDYAAAAREARNASGATTRSRAAALQGYADALLGRLPGAERHFAAATRSDPNNWSLWRDWARTVLATGNRRRAARLMAHAVALNPRMELPEGFVRGAAG
jgi:Flp pilus assembly protein TadD